MSREEKIRIARYTIEVVNHRVPVVIGAGGSDTREVIREIGNLPTDQAVAILSASPYYSKPSQEGIYQHYKAIAAASPIPVLIYNVPGRTARNVDASTILRLSELSNIAGIKEAGGDMAQWLGSLALQLQARTGVARQLANLWIDSLPPEELALQGQKIEKVTPQDVQAAGRKYFPAWRMTVIAVGEEQVIKDELAPFGLEFQKAP